MGYCKASETKLDRTDVAALQVRVRSFASRNQLAAYPTERQKGQELEWERRYVTVLGAANKRLYQFRLQSLDQTFEQSPVRYPLNIQKCQQFAPSAAVGPHCTFPVMDTRTLTWLV